MSSSETARGNFQVVTFPDEYTAVLQTDKGEKSFQYDTCFGTSTSQEQVFEDTKNLIQSAIDGYNVCIFAYGQTGSGKTFTMTGNEEYPGLTPRAVRTLFETLHEMESKNYTWNVTCYMVELYNENLVDLFYRVDHGTGSAAAKSAPKLDIKIDSRNMVTIKNTTIKQASSSEELLALFHAGNAKRHVGATNMNAESSRSHLVFATLIETQNTQTGQTAVGKLSMVDLAGSERVGKTGATAERLREAQAINKSLSALGEVISKLSTGDKHVPYRNNKLTRLMQDSLGGNAKTLVIFFFF